MHKQQTCMERKSHKYKYRKKHNHFETQRHTPVHYLIHSIRTIKLKLVEKDYVL